MVTFSFKAVIDNDQHTTEKRKIQRHLLFGSSPQ
jgi:pantothenate kinase